MNYKKIMIAFYKSINVIFGLDFGFFKYKTSSRRIFWKAATVMLAFFWCCVGVLCLGNKQETAIYVWYLFYLSHYFFTVVALVLVKPKHNFCSILSDLEQLDVLLRTDSASYGIEKLTLCMHLLHICFRIPVTVTCVFLNIRLKPLQGAIFFMTLVTLLHLISITYSMTFYSTNCRLKKLSSILKICNSDFFYLQKIYGNIVDIFEEHKSASDPLIILGLGFHIPELMAFIYTTVYQLLQEKCMTSLLLVELIMAAEFLVLLFATPICAHMMSTEADNIKLILHDKLMHDYDVFEVRRIERFIRYVEARPCRFRVWKVIPLDADLLSMVLSFCVTYLIVIIQFTNK